MRRSPKEDEGEEDSIDFSSAALYVSGVQTMCGVSVCAVTSILSCWVLPPTAVSAVRTLTLSSIAGAAAVIRPIRITKVHGLTVVFASLRPAGPLYLGCLVMEQLVHTCSTDSATTPSWRRVVFVCAVVAMLFSGFMRAREPLAKSDAPFLLTLVALLVVALLPPPAVALAGPLCEPPSLFSAAERVVRSLSFAGVFVTFVFCSTSPTSGVAESTVVVARSFAAAVWTTGAPAILLFLSVPQCIFAVLARLRSEPVTDTYVGVATASPSAENGLSGHDASLTHSPARPLSPAASEASTTKGNASAFGQLTLKDVGAARPFSLTGVCESRRLSKDDMIRLADAIQ